MTLTLTDALVKRIKALREQEGNPALMLRVAVDGGGCQGFEYRFDLTEDQNEEDKTIVDALSTLGWVEEPDEVKEKSTKDDGSLIEQVKFLREQNNELNEDLKRKSTEIENYKNDIQELTNEKAEALIRIISILLIIAWR